MGIGTLRRYHDEPKGGVTTKAALAPEAEPAGFASGAAEDAAAELGVTLAGLAGTEPSGKGGYTVADVKAAAEAEG